MFGICLYKELRCPAAPSVSTALGNQPHPEKARILEYFNKFKPIAYAPMLVKDVISGATIGTPAAYKDGDFSWESVDVYYFDKYNINLTPRFLEHVLQ